MKLLSQVKTLIYKDILLEWRSKHAINGILLYVVSTVFVCYQSFKSVDTLVWNTLYWIILLFAAVNAISRCFIQETGSRQLYYYNLIDPSHYTGQNNLQQFIDVDIIRNRLSDLRFNIPKSSR